MPAQQTPTRVRSVAIDVLRVAGVVAVAAGHLWGGGPESEPNAVRLAVYPWHVPLFFFLSGYFWSYGRTVRSEASRRGRSLLLPFAAWTLLLGIPIYVVLAIRGINPLREIGTVIWGGGLLQGPFAPYWFLPVLFLTTVLARALEGTTRAIAWGTSVAVLALCYFLGGELAHIPHDALFAFPCLLFLLAGQELARRGSHLKRPLLTAFIALAICAALVAARMSRPLDIKNGDFGTPVLSMLVAVTICASLTLIVRGLLDSRWQRAQSFIEEMATTLVVVLLTHTFWFAALTLFSENVVELRSPVIFIVGLALAWSTAFLVHRTPLSPVLAGVSQRQSSTQVRVKQPAPPVGR